MDVVTADGTNVFINDKKLNSFPFLDNGNQIFYINIVFLVLGWCYVNKPIGVLTGGVRALKA